MMWRGPGRGGGAGAEDDAAKFEKVCHRLGSNAGRQGEKQSCYQLRHWNLMKLPLAGLKM